jgi:hypothetical protein
LLRLLYDLLPAEAEATAGFPHFVGTSTPEISQTDRLPPRRSMRTLSGEAKAIGTNLSIWLVAKQG